MSERNRDLPEWPDGLEAQLQRLERAPVDALKLVLDTDLGTYPTAELLALYAAWRDQQQAVRKMYRQLMRWVAWSPAWLLLGVVGAWRGAVQWVLLFPGAVVLFFLGLVYLYLKFGSESQRQSIGDALRDELEWRQFKQRQDWETA